MHLSELSLLMQSLVGCNVQSKTIAGNSIWLWFDEEKTKGISIDPPWRILAAGEIIGSSADFPWERNEGESEANYRQRFEAACSNSNILYGAKLSRIIADPCTTDLLLEFENGATLASFTVWRHEQNWLYADYTAMKRFLVSPSGVEVESIDA